MPCITFSSTLKNKNERLTTKQSPIKKHGIRNFNRLIEEYKSSEIEDILQENEKDGEVEMANSAIQFLQEQLGLLKKAPGNPTKTILGTKKDCEFRCNKSLISCLSSQYKYKLKVKVSCRRLFYYAIHTHNLTLIKKCLDHFPVKLNPAKCVAFLCDEDNSSQRFEDYDNGARAITYKSILQLLAQHHTDSSDLTSSSLSNNTQEHCNVFDYITNHLFNKQSSLIQLFFPQFLNLKYYNCYLVDAYLQINADRKYYRTHKPQMVDMIIETTLSQNNIYLPKDIACMIMSYNDLPSPALIDLTHIDKKGYSCLDYAWCNFMKDLFKGNKGICSVLQKHGATFSSHFFSNIFIIRSIGIILARINKH